MANESKPPVVFYSWQSDLPNKTNRSLIREALEGACEDLGSECEDAERDAPRVDSDTQGLPGSPEISAAILTKIAAADVVVADVSIIGKAETPSGDRLVPNPNVMLELGYAKGVRGADRVIMLCNTAFGSEKELPFDIRGKRVTLYNYDGVGPKKEALKDLRRRLKMAIASALAAQPAAGERDATAKAATKELVDRRIHDFHTWRTQRVNEIRRKAPIQLVAGPMVVIQLASASALDGDDELVDLKSVERLFAKEMTPPGAGSFSFDQYPQSVVSRPGGVPTGPGTGWVQLFHDGIIEYVAVLPNTNDLSRVTWVAARGLRQIAPSQAKLGLQGPHFIGVEVLDTSGCTIPVDVRWDIDPYIQTRPIDTGALHLPTAVIEDLRAGDADAYLHHPLDHLWRTAGFKGCMHYGEDGRLAKW